MWQFIKDQLKEENFATIEALRKRVQQVLEQVTPERIISLSSYDFLLEASNSHYEISSGIRRQI